MKRVLIAPISCKHSSLNPDLQFIAGEDVENHGLTFSGFKEAAHIVAGAGDGDVD